METEFLWSDLIKIALGLTVLVIAFRLLVFRPADFSVRVRNGVLQFHGAFPRIRQSDFAELLLSDLQLRHAVAVHGVRRGGRLSVWFSGQISEGQKQRIRNFLLSRL